MKIPTRHSMGMRLEVGVIAFFILGVVRHWRWVFWLSDQKIALKVVCSYLVSITTY